MTGYTYPVTHPSGTLTTEQIHALLKSPTLIARRIASLADQKFIADYLLTGRYLAQGGGIFYESGEEIFAADDPKAVAPNTEYPLTVMSRGEIEAARVVKWGLATEVSDEAISRLGINPVDRGLARIVNSIIRFVDQSAWGVISTKVTATESASAAWTSAAAIIESLLTAQANMAEKGVDLGGLNPTTVVLSGTQYAKVLGVFAKDGVLPREAGNPIVSGSLPKELLGFEWVTSPNVSGTNPLLLDRDQLGGMADEKITSPGYIQSGGFGIEAKSIRQDERDSYRPQARRVTVPVVLEPNAGVRMTGTGL